MSDSLEALSKQNEDTLRILPLGGCGEFGMNLTLYIFRRKLIVVDCGVMFPDATKFGIEGIMPDVAPFFDRFKGVEAYVITHGHEDHIGALPYVVERWPAPIYATPWTASLIEARFSQRGLSNPPPVHIVTQGQSINVGSLSFEYIHVNHSIPMACALLIKSPHCSVFHTGDFKIDPTPVGETSANLERLSEIGKEGVDLVICDSTNAQSKGPSPSERSCIAPLEAILAAKDGLSIVTTFASNLWRLISVFEICKRLGKGVFVAGAGIENVLALADRHGLYKMPSRILIDEQQLARTPRGDVVVLATGSQGEWMSGLARISAGDHRQVKVVPGDRCVFSSRIIPGNERSVFEMADHLVEQGAEIFTTKNDPGIHVSGHAYRGDIEAILTLLRPKCFMPVHGTVTHLRANLSILGELKNCSVTPIAITNGDFIDVSAKDCYVAGQVPVETVYVDGGARLLTPPATVKERWKIGELGVAFFSGLYQEKKDRWLATPMVTWRGFRLPDRIDEDEWQESIADDVRRLLATELAKGNRDLASLHELVRIAIRKTINDAIARKIVVVPHISLA